MLSNLDNESSLKDNDGNRGNNKGDNYNVIL